MPHTPIISSPRLSPEIVMLSVNLGSIILWWIASLKTHPTQSQALKHNRITLVSFFLHSSSCCLIRDPKAKDADLNRILKAITEGPKSYITTWQTTGAVSLLSGIRKDDKKKGQAEKETKEMICLNEASGISHCHRGSSCAPLIISQLESLNLHLSHINCQKNLSLKCALRKLSCDSGFLQGNEHNTIF